MGKSQGIESFSPGLASEIIPLVLILPFFLFFFLFSLPSFGPFPGLAPEFVPFY